MGVLGTDENLKAPDDFERGVMAHALDVNRILLATALKQIEGSQIGDRHHPRASHRTVGLA